MLEKRSNLILTQALLVSGGLNVFFIGAFFFLIVQEAPLYFTVREVKASSTQAKHYDSSTAQVLTQLQALSLDGLIRALEDQTLIEDGFQTRDFALSLLVQEHHFDLKRAILGLNEPKQKKSFKIASNNAIHLLDLFSDLNEQHFKAIVDFAKLEKWPLTQEGLFFALKKNPEPSLKQAFMRTSFFMDMLSRAEEKPHDLLAKLLEQDSLTAIPLPSVPKVAKILPVEEKPSFVQKTHLVQEGESLWRISRNYKVEMAALKSLNHLHSDQIRPGQTLVIP